MTDKLKREIEKFGKICCKSQMELKAYLHSVLASNGYKVISDDGFLYAKGELPFLVTAHMDTVHIIQCERYSVHKYKGKHRIQSSVGIGGDDRCGIYMIVRMILDGYHPSVLFCEDEEIGSVGARKFIKTKFIKELESLNYLIELDRANAKDIVFYDCDNPEFTKYIQENTGFKEAQGSWTDIVELSDACGVASVNFSCGYYNAHTTKEYVIFEEMQNTIAVVEKLLRDTECGQFEFIEKVKYFGGYSNSLKDYYKYGYADDWYSGYDYSEDAICGIEIHYNDYTQGTAEEQIVWMSGTSVEECMYTFFRQFPDVCFNDIIERIII